MLNGGHCEDPVDQTFEDTEEDTEDEEEKDYAVVGRVCSGNNNSTLPTISFLVYGSIDGPLLLSALVPSAKPSTPLESTQSPSM